MKPTERWAGEKLYKLHYQRMRDKAIDEHNKEGEARATEKETTAEEARQLPARNELERESGRRGDA